MPTRVVIRDPGTATPTGAALRPRKGMSLRNVSERFILGVVGTPSPSTGGSQHPAVSSSPTAEFLARRSMARMMDIENNRKREPSSRSIEDISGSRRLGGYLFCFMGSLVLTISAVKLRKIAVGRTAIYWIGEQHSVRRYKMEAAIAVGAFGCFYNLVVILLHFDQWICPKWASKVFSAGSKWERNLLFVLAFYWMAGVHICTSAFSTGIVQPNIFFCSWLCLFSIFVNYEVWRIGAGKRPIYQILATHKRKTCVYWAGSLFFTAVTFGAVLDMYIEKRYAQTQKLSRDAYNLIDISERTYIRALSVYGCIVIICVFTLYFSIILPIPKTLFTVPCLHGSTWDVDFRHVEGITLFGIGTISVWSFVAYTGTKREGLLTTGPFNAYLGIWGTFICTFLAIGEWIQAHKQNLFARKQKKRLKKRQQQKTPQSAETDASPTNTNDLVQPQTPPSVATQESSKKNSKELEKTAT